MWEPTRGQSQQDSRAGGSPGGQVPHCCSSRRYVWPSGEHRERSRWDSRCPCQTWDIQAKSFRNPIATRNFHICNNTIPIPNSTTPDTPQDKCHWASRMAFSSSPCRIEKRRSPIAAADSSLSAAAPGRTRLGPSSSARSPWPYCAARTALQSAGFRSTK